ncbi:PREDICTED: uncharacterized protein LOC107344511 [Acropora digitifera]|uniref:uncharacterized protein LOC107344511 n=1 Tax=Acropora digitifera TaxID=70779 RepID=UPI00077A036E|nr:PREDICTED: uncharacterized protein LOC107344511 [Acropora digitifera]
MNNTLLDCKAKSQALANSQNPPRKENGRKKGYMAIVKELWDNCGYAELNIPEKNLRNQAGKLEKDMGNVQSTMLRNAGERTREIDQEINGLESNKDNFEQGNENTTNLHTRELQRPEGDEILLTNEVTTVLEGAAPRFTLISQTIGDFTMREVDTRVKQRPTHADINNINLVVSEIVDREQQQHSINPNRKPFEYLWMINCILYAVIVAFLFYKKWKKPAETKGQKERKTQSQKMNGFYTLGRSYSTVNTYRSAISATIHSVKGRDLGSNHLVSTFMKGIYVAKPPLPRYTATWDVSKVIDYLRYLSCAGISFV